MSSFFSKNKRLLTLCSLVLSILLMFPLPVFAEFSDKPDVDNKETESRENYNTDLIMKSSSLIGGCSGALVGTATIFWSMTGDVSNDTPQIVDTLTTFPSILIGSYVGIKTSEWTASKMIKNSDDSFIPFFFKGVFLSSLSGALILTSSFLPLFLTAHYTNSIHFNMNGDTTLLKLAGISAAGGIGYGAVFGALIGSVWTSFVYIILN